MPFADISVTVHLSKIFAWLICLFPIGHLTENTADRSIIRLSAVSPHTGLSVPAVISGNV